MSNGNLISNYKHKWDAKYFSSYMVSEVVKLVDDRTQIVC